MRTQTHTHTTTTSDQDLFLRPFPFCSSLPYPPPVSWKQLSCVIRLWQEMLDLLPLEGSDRTSRPPPWTAAIEMLWDDNLGFHWQMTALASQLAEERRGLACTFFLYLATLLAIYNYFMYLLGSLFIASILWKDPSLMRIGTTCVWVSYLLFSFFSQGVDYCTW